MEDSLLITMGIISSIKSGETKIIDWKDKINAELYLRIEKCFDRATTQVSDVWSL